MYRFQVSCHEINPIFPQTRVDLTSRQENMQDLFYGAFELMLKAKVEGNNMFGC